MKRKLKNQMLLEGQKGVDSEAELETLIFKKKKRNKSSPETVRMAMDVRRLYVGTKRLYVCVCKEN